MPCLPDAASRPAGRLVGRRAAPRRAVRLTGHWTETYRKVSSFFLRRRRLLLPLTETTTSKWMRDCCCVHNGHLHLNVLRCCGLCGETTRRDSTFRQTARRTYGRTRRMTDELPVGRLTVVATQRRGAARRMIPTSVTRSLGRSLARSGNGRTRKDAWRNVVVCQEMPKMIKYVVRRGAARL